VIDLCPRVVDNPLTLVSNRQAHRQLGEYLRTLASKPNGKLQQAAANGHVDTLKVLDFSGDSNAEVMSAPNSSEHGDRPDSMCGSVRDTALVMHHVAASDGSHLIVLIRREQVGKPFGAGHSVVVGEGDDVGSCMARSRLHGSNNSRLIDDAFLDDPVQRRQDLSGPLILGPANDHDLIWRRIETKNSLKARAKLHRASPSWNDHAYSGRRRLRRIPLGTVLG
jgi:hypothetical protein